MSKYVFEPYDPIFKKLFLMEKERLKKILPSDSVIEHFGSTAVPGLAGKGVIDIMVSMKESEIDNSRKILEKNGYEYRKEAGDKDRTFLRIKRMYDKKIRWFHIHLTPHGSLAHKKAISLRNYLRNNPDVCGEYEEVKKKAVEICMDSGEIYRREKNDYLKELTRKAMKSN